MLHVLIERIVLFTVGALVEVSTVGRTAQHVFFLTGTANIIYLLNVLLQLLVVVAFTAQRHVHVGTADELLGRALACAERIVGVRRADLADGGQLLDLLAERNQFEDVLPALLLVRAVQSTHNDDLAGVGSRFSEINDLNEEDIHDTN